MTTTGSAMTTAAALQALQTYVRCRRERDAEAKGVEAAGVVLKSWFMTYPGETLYDEGSGYEARLTTQHASPRYDVPSMPDALVVWAAKHGLLDVDHKALTALNDKWAEIIDVRRYAIPGGETQRLRVDKREG